MGMQQCYFIIHYYKILPNYDNFHFWEPQKCKKGQLFLSSIFIKLMFLEKHIRMPSEGIWHWNNVCWKFSFAITGINYILKCNTIKNSLL